ncbi:MAG: (Fe-S)-binding protein [Bacteroidetes bacterium]|nr:(Fe-S)-binding protein [Bacteroidota bacterium]
MSNREVMVSNDLISKCIHCGLCLPTCPTYNLTLNEQSSPRGRIQLMKNVFENKAPISDQFVYEMQFCLDCQACQTACPAGVQYGSLVEEARNLISKSNRESTLYKIFKFIFLKQIIYSSKNLKLVYRVIRIIQNIFNVKIVNQLVFNIFEAFQSTKVFNLFPKVSEKPFDELVSEFLPAYGKANYSVIFPYGCIMNLVFSKTQNDTVEVLRHAGCNVIIPKNQSCCGSLHKHNGEIGDAKNLAKQNIILFNKYKFDYLIQNSSGCGAFMKEYGNLFQDDDRFSETAITFSKKCKDFSEFLVGIKYNPPNRELNQKITYHDACHLIHSQSISKEPRQLISLLNKNGYVELNEASWCCGSAGIYNVTHTKDSLEILDRKMDNLINTQADIVITNNPGCLLQLEYGIKKRKLNMKAMHLATLLNNLYQ